MSQLTKWVGEQVEKQVAAGVSAETKRVLDEIRNSAALAKITMDWGKSFNKSWWFALVAAAAAGAAPVVIDKMQTILTSLQGNRAIWAAFAAAVIGYGLGLLKDWWKHRKPVPM